MPHSHDHLHADRARFRPGPIAIVRSTRPVHAGTLRAIQRGGVEHVEITLGTPECLALVRYASESGVRAGVGTVRTLQDADDAMDAGAAFLVTPTTVPAIIEAASARRVPIVCGALTPTEIDLAWQLGADAVKVFPIDALGGERYLTALQAPLSDVAYVPTGGVDATQAQAYARAGCVGVGIGSALVDSTLLRERRWDVLEERARAIASAWHEGTRLLDVGQS